MKPSVLLFDLVKSLSEEEKQNFQKSASLQQGEKNYLKLFRYLDNVNEYNEEAVKQHFKHETFARHLASEKNQLLHHILKSLRLSRVQTKMSANTFDRTKDVHVLFAKGLIKLAQKEVDEIRQLTIDNELCYSHLKLIEVELRFINSLPVSDEKKAHRLSELFNEKEECLKKISVLNTYEKLFKEVEYYFNQNILVHDRSKKHLLESYLNNPFLSDLSKANTTRAKLLATYSRLICFRIINENTKLGIEINNAIELYRKYPHLKVEYPKLFINLQGFSARYMAINADLKKAKLIIDNLRFMRNDKCFDTVDLQNTIFTRLAVYDLTYHNYSGQFEKSLDLAVDIEVRLEANKDRIPGYEQTTINFLMFAAHFAKGAYNRALKCINEIVNADFEESRQDLYRYAKICNLIIHYELGNTEYLNYSYKSAVRFFKTIDYPFEYELAFLKHFKNFALSKKKSDNPKLYLKEFKTNLQEIFKDPYQMMAVEYFDLIAWVDSKLNETPYEREIRNTRANQQ